LLQGAYRIEEFLGEGGMGQVYLARHEPLGSTHAVKVVHPDSYADDESLALGKREALTLQRVHHDAVVAFEGFFPLEQGQFFLVMEYVDGVSLADLAEVRSFTPQQVLLLRDRLGGGLAALHAASVVHRDIAPDNVLVPNEDVRLAKWIDLGLAKTMQFDPRTILDGTFSGKYRYASPEQFGLYGGQVSERSDIYSFAVMLVEVARGRTLEMGNTMAEAVDSRKSVPDLSGVPAALVEQFRHMLQPHPDDRPASIREVLERWPAAKVLGGAGRPGRRLKAAVLVVGVVAGIVGARYLYTGIQSAGPSLDSDSPTSVPNADLPLLHARSMNLRRQGRLADAAQLWQQASANRAAEVHAFATALLAQRASATDDTAAQELCDEALTLFELTWNAGYGPSALRIGEMYDPAYWNPSASVFSEPRASSARIWYERAHSAGVPEAQSRLGALPPQ
jgi:serine/threonine-protein kinase